GAETDFQLPLDGIAARTDSGRGINIEAIDIAVENDIHHPAKGADAVNATSRAGQGLNPLNGVDGNGIYVRLTEKATDRDAGHAPAIDQDQGIFLAQAAKVHRRPRIATGIRCPGSKMGVGGDAAVEKLFDIVPVRGGEIRLAGDIVRLNIGFETADVGV